MSTTGWITLVGILFGTGIGLYLRIKGDTHSKEDDTEETTAPAGRGLKDLAWWTEKLKKIGGTVRKFATGVWFTPAVIFGLWFSLVFLVLPDKFPGIYKWITKEDPWLLMLVPTISLIVVSGIEYGNSKEKRASNRFAVRIFAYLLFAGLLAMIWQSFRTKSSVWREYKMEETSNNAKVAAQVPARYQFCWRKPPGSAGLKPELRQDCYAAEIIRNDKVVFEFVVEWKDNYQPVQARFFWDKTKDPDKGTWSQPTPEDNPLHGEWYLEPDGAGGFMGGQRDQLTPEGSWIPFQLRRVQ